jgi:phosphate transport system permease protein
MSAEQDGTEALLLRELPRFKERLFIGLCCLAAALPIALVLVLVGAVAMSALGRLDWGFLIGYPSRFAGRAGILPALAGSACLLALTAVIALPAGVGSAIYLEEYSGRSRLVRLIESNLASLAAAPSVIYGLLGLGIFVRALGLGRSVLAGAATLALLVLPIVIGSARAALRSVPQSLREACHALGVTRWQAIRCVVLPMALPGIVTGAIRAMSRALGETAPLLVVGALSYVTFLPDGVHAPFTALPVQIFNWVLRPEKEFLADAAAGIIVLLAALLLLNALALVLRSWLEKRSV